MRKKQYTIFVFCLTITIILMSSVLTINTVLARTEEILDSGNNNLKMSMQAPNDWNSGIISQTVAKLNWRLNGLTATNDDLSAFFAVVNLPNSLTSLSSLWSKDRVTILNNFAIRNDKQRIRCQVK